jgi:CSLREA domain-containing protein
MISSKEKKFAGNGPLAVDFLLAALLVASCLLLAARPAHADGVLTVTSTADPGDGHCATKGCTLREAINEANHTNADTIWFDIPDGGVKTISQATPLPDISDPVTIDGYTQPGASPNTLTNGTNAVLKIEINGGGWQNAGLYIEASDCVIKGLVINRFDHNGIQIVGPGGSDNRIVGNFIGIDPSGTLDLGNEGSGVVVTTQDDTSGNTIGGGRPAARNLISGNENSGVGIYGATDTAIFGNLIGTSKNGTDALGNSGAGVSFVATSHGAADNIVGGSLPGDANTIAFNGGDGIQAEQATSTGNSFLRNSIFDNGGLGIDLDDDGTTANDTDDGDTGPNNLQNKPNLTSAKNSAATTTVKGSLNSVPNRTFRIRFYSNPSGNEGKKYIGAKKVATGDDGDTGTFTFKPENKVGASQNITATATRLLAGDTSEFSGSEDVVAQ